MQPPLNFTSPAKKLVCEYIDEGCVAYTRVLEIYLCDRVTPATRLVEVEDVRGATVHMPKHGTSTYEAGFAVGRMVSSPSSGGTTKYLEPFTQTPLNFAPPARKFFGEQVEEWRAKYALMLGMCIHDRVGLTAQPIGVQVVRSAAAEARAQYVLGQQMTNIAALDQQHKLNYDILATVIERGYAELDHNSLVKQLSVELEESEDSIERGLNAIDSIGGFHVAAGSLALTPESLEGLDEIMDKYVFI